MRLAEQRMITVDWHLMSLSVLNEGRADDPEGDPEGYLWVPVRICAAVLDGYGQDALVRFYRALWHREPDDDSGNDWLKDFAASLRSAGLPEELAGAGSGEDFDSAIRDSHAAGVALVGPGLGTPVIRIRNGRTVDRAYFGPVITSPVDDAEGRKLWQAITGLAAIGKFTELKTGIEG